jgi:hypothetical protein
MGTPTHVPMASMTGMPFTAMLPATSNFASGFDVPIPTLPEFLEKMLGGLSQKFQFRYTHGPISLNSVVFAAAIFFVIEEILFCDVVGVAFTTENVMVTQSRTILTLSTSLNLRDKFFCMIGPPLSIEFITITSIKTYLRVFFIV